MDWASLDPTQDLLAKPDMILGPDYLTGFLLFHHPNSWPICTAAAGERVIVVTHGGVLRAIYMAITREPTAGKVLNASINVLHPSEKKWAFKSWSDVAHLNEVGFLQRGFNGDSLQQ